MKIIILEGIATSGKTSVAKLLKAAMEAASLEVSFIDENKTLMPILEDHNIAKNLSHCNKILELIKKNDSDYVILDRFYFSHLYRCYGKEKDFVSVFDYLKKNVCLAVLLTIPEGEIAERIFKAAEHRDPSWLEFVNKKGDHKQIIEYYTHQQNEFLKLFKESGINQKIFDTKNKNFEKIALSIFNSI